MAIKKVANYDLANEELLRRMSYFDYLSHIFALKKNNDESEMA